MDLRRRGDSLPPLSVDQLLPEAVVFGQRLPRTSDRNVWWGLGIDVLPANRELTYQVLSNEASKGKATSAANEHR